MIGYAYAGAESDVWGLWATRFQPIAIEVTDEPDTGENKAKNTKETMTFGKREDYPVGISTKEHEIRVNLDAGSTELAVYWIDMNSRTTQITDAKEISFSDYDTSIIKIDGLSFVPLKTGTTTVRITYKGLVRDIKITVIPAGDAIKVNYPKVVALEPLEDTLTISLSNPEPKQLRAYATFEDGAHYELYGDVNNTKYPARQYRIFYATADKKIAAVGANSILRAKAVGTTVITVSCGTLSYDVTVHVIE